MLSLFVLKAPDCLANFCLHLIFSTAKDDMKMRLKPPVTISGRIFVAELKLISLSVAVAGFLQNLSGVWFLMPNYVLLPESSRKPRNPLTLVTWSTMALNNVWN